MLFLVRWHHVSLFYCLSQPYSTFIQNTLHSHSSLLQKSVLVLFIAYRSAECLLWGVTTHEPRIGLGPALKGQCHEIFCFRFFSWINFPQAPDNNIRIISNFFENSRRYLQVKVHHRCQRHRWQICHRYQRHRRQILPPVSLVLLTPVANLPPVSICRRCQRRRWQIATGINDTGGKFAAGVIDTGGK